MMEPHVLTARLQCKLCAPGEHYLSCFTYVLECPGVVDECRLWDLCDVAGCKWTEEIDEAEGIAHGVRHQDMEAGWCTPTDRCFAATYPELETPIEYLLISKPGTYPVKVDIVDTAYLDLEHWEEE